ncbi:hypothetical protein COR50_11100 [Chitinophaga caeni]|uniref:DUF2199 domain-containing protein n=1 Tax=Chitinophaga caeni TaxID=2029983 RepID=A0A291QUM2_9BACT|nr:DUF2199 domain-containing protein [Chitinophaga caeni]ATL47668.1 hypothetical protein COR50_11100 [Chitinophaga caeni]
MNQVSLDFNWEDELPAIAFEAPYQYMILSEQDRSTIAMLEEQSCIIRHEQQTDYFIKALLIQKLVDEEMDLQYQVWVSISEENFRKFTALDPGKAHDEQYFGWLASQIPGYDKTLNLKTVVLYEGENHWPVIIPKENDDSFTRDFYEGIIYDDAVARVEAHIFGNPGE